MRRASTVSNNPNAERERLAFLEIQKQHLRNKYLKRLRDQYAGQTAAAMARDSSIEWTVEQVVRISFRVANAMIEEIKRQDEEICKSQSQTQK